MNAFTRMSEKGQVVVPKALRDRKGWPAGTDLEVVDVGEGVLLRLRRPAKALTVAEAIARLQATIRYDGPRMDEADWQRGIDEEVGRRHPRR